MASLDPQIMHAEPARPRHPRLAALCAVALIVLSCGLLGSMAGSGPPLQSVGWVFGPAPSPAP